MRRIPLCLLAVAALSPLCRAEFPEARISNGRVTAKLYLPNAEQGYYRGTRFDWSGVIQSLKVDGHEYFGQWFEKYDPKLHDAIMGPVEEFLTAESTLGYDEAPVGGTFIRIGVGVLRKPDNGKFQRFKTYQIVDPGRWTVRPDDDHIEFIHELNDGAGYAYRYKKTIRLPGKKPELVIEHELKNTGTKPISTMQYNHNFFVIDNTPVGAGHSVTFPFTLKPKQPLTPELAKIEGNRVQYLAEIPRGKSVATELEGFGNTAKDFDVRIENATAHAGVRIQGDRPIQKIVYWSIRSTLCPEPYISLSAEPGRETKWTYRYTFYTLDKKK